MPALTCSGDQPGFASRMRAAIPATCGADIDVPVSVCPPVPVLEAAEDLVLARHRHLYRVGLAKLDPAPGAQPVGDIGVDILSLHQGKGLGMAEIVAGSTRAYIPDRLDRQGGVVDLDAAHATHGLAKHVVVDDQAFQAETEQRGVHAGRLVDEVEAGEPGHHVGDALLVARLDVGKLGIRHPRRRSFRRDGRFLPRREIST